MFGVEAAYRDILIGARPDTMLIYLRGSKALIARADEGAKGHFMPPALLDSQFATLEEPGPDEHPIIVDIGASADARSRMRCDNSRNVWIG